MALSLGIALGLTNSLVRGLIHRGWVRATGIKPHRVRYLLTPAGIAEKARLSQAAFHNSVARYRVARTRVQQAFARVSAEWPGGADTDPKHILFYGSGEVAEIGYICLQETDLQLVGVIDDQGRSRFFGVPVYSTTDLADGLTGDAATARVVVMSLIHTDEIRANLRKTGCPDDRAIWI